MTYKPFPPVDGAPGAAAPTEALQVGGSDGTDLRVLATDASGRLRVVQYRSDGHAYPLGSKGAALEPGGGTGTVIAAPGAGNYILIHSIVPPSEYNTAGATVYKVTGTVNGGSFVLLAAATPTLNIVPTPQSYIPPGGLLLDVNTAVALTVSSTPTNGYPGTIFYDIVT